MVGGSAAGPKGSVGSDADSDEEEEADETADEEELPPAVPEPVLPSKTVKMLFCVDTLGMQNALAPEQLRRVEKFATAVRERCVATREAAVKKQVSCVAGAFSGNPHLGRFECTMSSCLSVHGDKAPLLCFPAPSQETFASAFFTLQYSQSEEARDKQAPTEHFQPSPT